MPVKNNVKPATTTVTPIVKAPLATVIPKIPNVPVVKRENQTTMTDTGKYSYSMDPTSGALTMKEMSLKRQLDDTEMLVQEHMITIQRQRDENRDLELKLK